MPFHIALFFLRLPSAFRSRVAQSGNEPSIIQVWSFGDGLMRKRRLLADVGIAFVVVRMGETIMGRRGRIGGRSRVFIVFFIGQFRTGWATSFPPMT